MTKGARVDAQLGRGGEGDREHDGDRCVVMKRLGHDDAECIDDDQGGHRPEIADAAHEAGSDEAGGAGLRHRIGDAEPAADRDQHGPVHASRAWSG